MNQSLYKLGIFFLSLSVAGGLLQSYVHFQLGSQIYFLQPFANWFLVVNIISLAGIGFLLKYFHFKRYRLAFFTGALAAVAALAHFIIIYIRLVLVARVLDTIGVVLLLLVLGTGITFALSLIYSNTKHRFWLRAAGGLMVLTNLLQGGLVFWSSLLRNVQVFGTFEKVSQWLLLFTYLVPVLFILNFRGELKAGEAEPEELKNTRSEFLEGLVAGVAVIALGLSIYFGSGLSQAAFWSLRWSKKGPEEARQLAKAFENRTYISREGDTMQYLLMKPLNYEPENKYPLVVCLHGGPIPLSAPRNRPSAVPEPAPLLAEHSNRKKYPAFLLIPQGPPGISWGGIPNTPAADSLVFEIIQFLEKEFSIDERRRYVAGGSGGGYGTWYFIGTRPEIFAAAIPFCGEGNPEHATKIAAIPVWAFHGSQDRNVPVKGSREMIAAIRKAGGNPRYTEFPGVGHNVWPHINQTPGLLEWLFAQKRN